MKNTKFAIVVLAVCTMLLSIGLAYTLWLYTLQNQMTISTYKEVQVEYPLGTKITSWNWNEFNQSNPYKSQVFYLRSYSNVALNVTWNVTNLDPAFSFNLNVTMFQFTMYNQVIPFEATLNLTDYSKPAGQYSFNLEFGE